MARVSACSNVLLYRYLMSVTRKSSPYLAKLSNRLAMDVGAVLAAAARAAEEVWRAGGGPSGAEHARARETHRLSLLLLAVQNEISRLHASPPRPIALLPWPQPRVRRHH